MDTFDSQGRVSPIRAADQDLVSKKIEDKEGQGQGFQHHHQKKVEPAQIPEQEDENKQTDDHIIDIIV
jgi:hypothetical protein